MGLATFKRVSGTICKEIRNSQKAPGETRIYTAGEKEWDAYNERSVLGVPIPESLQKVMTYLRDKFNLDYEFEFEER
jgi:L-2-hydroxycarboxylate dehydrogenase (NAD+)